MTREADAQVAYTVGRRLAAARLAAGLSQGDVARACGVGQGAVSRWESGDRLLTLADLSRYAEAVGVEPGGLLPPRP